MTTTRREPRNVIFAAIEAPMIASGYTLTDAPGSTITGTRLDQWLRSLTTNGALPSCAHSRPGVPSMLHTDDPDPMIRCVPCVAELLPLPDDGVCHICGQPSATFREFAVAARHQLVVAGNACRDCYRDMAPGRPGSP